MKSCVQPDSTLLTMTAPVGGVTADVPVVIGGLCVVPVADADAGALFAGYTVGVFELPKATGVGTDFDAGDVVEWDASAAVCIANGGAAGDFDLGYVVAAVGVSDTTVKVAKVLATTTVNS